MVTSLQQPPRGQGCPHSHPTRNPELRTRNPLARPVPIFFLIAATRCNKLQPGATPGQNRRSGAATLNSVFGVPPSGGGQIPRSGATLTFKPETCLRSQAAFIRHKATQPGTVTWLNGYIVTTTPTRTRLSALPCGIIRHSRRCVHPGLTKDSKSRMQSFDLIQHPALNRDDRRLRIAKIPNPEPGTQKPEPASRIRFRCQRTSHPP